MTTRPNLRIVSDEPRDNKGMCADAGQLDHPYRAKRDAQTKAEYANPYSHYRPRVSKKTKLGYAVAAILVLGAIFFGAM